MSDAAPVIVFDGVCLLCSRWVRFVLRHDTAGSIRFAPMQSASGRVLFERFGLDPDDPSSLLYVVDGHGFTDSDAILRVLASFGGAWRLTAACRLIPHRLRDVLYRLLARNRYRWFGRMDQCLVPTQDQAARFLD
jgi:predicted DCC family thiol-disulfide oxidoreductase YuxK